MCNNILLSLSGFFGGQCHYMLTVLITSTYASDILYLKKKELLQQAQRIHFFNVVETQMLLTVVTIAI